VDECPRADESGIATYRDVAAATDLLVTTTDAKVEWFYLLKNESAASHFKIDLTLPSGIKHVTEDPGGALALRDARHKTRLRIERPFAVDSRGLHRDVDLAFDPHTSQIAISVDTSNLTYPILIDPSVAYPVWELVNAGSQAPVPTYGSGMAFDVARGKLVLFGGDVEADPFVTNATWEWDGTNWTEMSPASSPPARYGCTMVYDIERSKIVMFGGMNWNSSNFLFGDTWEWDGTNWAEQAVTISPSARAYAPMAYDSVRQKTVLFGGSTDRYNFGYTDESVNPLGDTWEWNGTNWAMMTPATMPIARSNAALAYDAARSKTILFGGKYGPSGSVTVLDDMWSWNGTNWTSITPTTLPSARTDVSISYDSDRMKTVLFAGSSKTTVLNDTWEWDGTNWLQRTPTTSPTERWLAPMAYDSLHKKTVLFGGDEAVGLNDTWLWDGTNWAVPLSGNAPPAREMATMAYDSTNARVVLFGGSNSGVGEMSDTWLWDGSFWTSPTLATSPSARIGASMDYDSLRKRTVLFGGDGSAVFNDTWEWDGTVWLLKSPTASPSTRSDCSMAYDSVRNVSLLFGGVHGAKYLNETWTYNGTTWTKAAPVTSPPLRADAMMSFDSGRSKAVLFGGFNGSTWLGDTWEWDGTTWLQRTPTNAPSARTESMMAYDVPRARTVLFSGDLSTGSANDTWEWDGTNWTSPSIFSPSARTFASMVFDTHHGIVLFGGNTGPAENSNETWLYVSLAGACTTSSQCDTGACVDGVCCNLSACGSCQSCGIAGKEGTCSNVPANTNDPDTCVLPSICSGNGVCTAQQGAACSSSNQCVTGFCADGVCCDSACTGDCQACAMSRGLAENGTCAFAPEGAEGRNKCANNLLCDGKGPACPSTCADDATCPSGYYCNESSTCAPQKSQGVTCNNTAGGDCLTSGCRECAPIGSATSGQCVDGVCCDKACDDACDVCNAGASIGTCANAPAGSAGNPLCAPNLCTGTSPTCATTCTSDSNCATGAYCDTTTGECRGNQALGSKCTHDAACASNNCVDGVCCSTPCEGKCEACDVSEMLGTCSPVNGAPHGTRGACTLVDDGGSASGDDVICATGTCDGTDPTKCNSTGGTTQCRGASCTNGVATFTATCNGSGLCGDVQTKTCAPYACGTTECNTMCMSDTDCSTGASCASNHTCVTGASCSLDGTSVITNTGQSMSCSPYVCEGSACIVQCSSVKDCATGFACDATGACVVSGGTAAPSSGCGCRIGAQDTTRSAWVFAIAAITLIGAQRRRRAGSQR
jgi:MYXO-CTERM domain-containing protein